MLQKGDKTMNLKRCENGHFYDVDKFSTCPHCNKGENTSEQTQSVAYDKDATQDVKTSKMGDGFEPSLHNQPVKEKGIEVPNRIFAGANEENKTVGVFKKQIGKNKQPVVGWLVCVQGGNFGEDFKLVAGRNFVGRDRSMHVCLSEDSTVSRIKHAIVVYEPKKNIFLVQPGDSQELFYLGDEVVISAMELKANDVLLIGETELLFIPCCTDKFTWDNKDKEN